MGSRRQRKQLCVRTLGTRKLSLLLLAAIFYFIMYHLPPPPKTKNNTNSDRKPPKYDIDTTPRFLHLSPFRENPDTEYERQVSKALSEIQSETLRKNNGDIFAEEKIWQIALGRNVKRESDSFKFEQKNGDWEYSLIDDIKAYKFITDIFSSVPELKKLYNSYPYHVIRSDLIRYLLLWYYGGFYADMDVYPAQSIKSCPALEPLWDSDTKSRNISLVIGIEIDEPHASPRLMHEWRWTRRYQFIQYTIYAPRRFSPILLEVIVRALSHTRQHIMQSNFIIGPQYKENTILEITGPGVFTDTVLDIMSQTLPPTHNMIELSIDADTGVGDLISPSTGITQRRVTWAPFTKISEPVCVDDSEAIKGKSMGGICILPISVWGNGQRHSGSESFSSRQACINHRFGRTWRKGWMEYFFG
ncbi:hypothetical protein BDV36DRAFT_252746 [Aspergillus pseudocaelatus]|uniref:Nucleotide-diphospho-sugar transferase n=1 Tax=Aspergillus pseudocaelatus TaxID=1825620 RepID=A0ABQ6WQV3_9EURO|nr:hypothetical protein BDV36DRAFT_252746 [Aspergillus pseudocaelatus]